ncbi:MAG: DUF6088 family protein [Treponema sp.]|nr:DUF6088 family protein [Treponema sp.]
MFNSTEAIRNYLTQTDDGSLFSINEFLDYASYENAKKIVQRLEKNGELVRIIDGIYSKPKISKLLNKPVPVSLNDVASKIAEKFAWNIIPSGDIALNMLHLSTQVPVCYEYLSDGPYREYEVYGMKLSFKHTTKRNIEGLSAKSALVIQSLKTLGASNITEDTLETLKTVLSEEEKKTLITECRRAPAWICEQIKKIGV